MTKIWRLKLTYLIDWFLKGKSWSSSWERPRSARKKSLHSKSKPWKRSVKRKRINGKTLILKWERILLKPHLKPKYTQKFNQIFKLSSKTWKGVVKKNKFETPDNHENKIGVGTNSLSNRVITANGTVLPSNSSASASAALASNASKSRRVV